MLVTGGDLLELEKGDYRGRLSPLDQAGSAVSYVELEPEVER